ncbi:MAG TPA: hypothetical protein VGJ87_10920 [Roseiflexaceae bacterium]|jgi:DNA uptake protein ComE-like DNA-binding protein
MLREMSKLQVLVITALMTFVLAACGATTGSPATGAAPSSSAHPAASSATAPTIAEPSGTVQPDTSAATASTTAKLNLNEVTADQLLSTIPNFSDRMVREFFEYRPYISIQQFRKEIGKYVSTEQVAVYEQYVYVPIDVDQADATTLQQLPGVDATIAEALVVGRPYGSNQAFLTKLAGYLSDASAKQVEAYLAAK